jgi:hypothetical protein
MAIPAVELLADIVCDVEANGAMTSCQDRW